MHAGGREGSIASLRVAAARLFPSVCQPGGPEGGGDVFRLLIRRPKTGIHARICSPFRSDLELELALTFPAGSTVQFPLGDVAPPNVQWRTVRPRGARRRLATAARRCVRLAAGRGGIPVSTAARSHVQGLGTSRLSLLRTTQPRGQTEREVEQEKNRSCIRAPVVWSMAVKMRHCSTDGMQPLHLRETVKQ